MSKAQTKPAPAPRPDARGRELVRASRRIVHAQELERRWVARELHDSVNQILSSAKFRLQCAGRLGRADAQALCREVEKARKLVEVAIHEVRRISHNLRPALLDDFGLEAAVRNLCEDFKERTDKAVELDCSLLEGDIQSDIAVTLYRIVQEAFQNIEKHSAADRIQVRIAREEEEVHLRIRDNGRGFDPAAVQSKGDVQSGLGLMHIRERAMFMGGTALIHSAPQCGTEIAVWIPLKRRATDHLEKK